MFENINVGKKSIYNVDIFTAMQCTCEDWKNCTASVIYNCFKHYLKQSSNPGMDAEEELNDSALQSMERDAEHGVTFTRAALSGLLNQEDEKMSCRRLIVMIWCERRQVYQS